MQQPILIVGDVHLGKSLSIGKPGIGAELNSRILDCMDLLNWVLSVAKNKEVKRIIFTGDIFHEPKPDYRQVVLFIGFLKRCESENISIDIVAGNHDIKRSGQTYTSVLDVITTAKLPTVNVYKEITSVEFNDDLRITYLPFRDRTGLECKTSKEAIEKLRGQLLEQVSHDEKPALLIGHVSVEGAIFVGDESDNMFNELMCPASVFAGFDMSIFGHVHKPQIISTKPYVAHIGSLDISDFGETEQTKVLYLIDAENLSDVETIDVPTRPLRKVVIDVPAGIEQSSTDFVIDQIALMNETKSFKDAIVRIELKFEDANAELTNRADVEKYLYNYDAFHICGITESRSAVVVASNKQEDIDNTIDPKTAVKLYADNLIFESDENKTRYIEYASDLIDEYFMSISK
jgi:exonuclease SbcD